ncbi:MAG: hypothetical protein IH991_18545 [Planctomycetes bacterium]|nr:hypothetical protein [Planctomycetota bacterium]
MSDFKTPLSVGRISPMTAAWLIEDIVATVLDITVEAWVCLCKQERVQATDIENDITDRLRWEMSREKQRRTPSPQLRFERETQRDDADKEFPTGRIDVFVIYSFEEDEYFAMECKKVDDRHETSAKKYVKNGVCRFSEGKYSPGHPYAAMIAFVSEGTRESAAEYIGRYLIAYNKSSTKIDEQWGWQTETGFGTLPDLYSSRHCQAGTGNTIQLLHLFLDCCGHA